MEKKSKYIMPFLGGVAAAILAEEKIAGKARKRVLNRLEDDNMKFQEYYSILLQWIHIHNKGKSLENYLKECGYNTLAIYGMKELGAELLYELKDSEIEVKYAIDKNAKNIFSEINVFSPEENLEQVDAVIVTAVHWFDSIEKDMKKKMSCPILSLEDLVYDL